jgi:hypothetical protein
MKTLQAATLAFVLMATAAQAAPIVVDFSFTPTGGSFGVVTGELEFAAAGTNVAATDLYVFTGPSGALFPSQADVDYAPFGFVNANSFTVSAAGAISAADLDVVNPAYTSELKLDYQGEDELYNYQGDIAYTYSGLSGITFTPADSSPGPAPVPEPASATLAAAGVLALGVLRRRKNLARTGLPA